MGRRIKLGPHFHAEEGKTPGHLHEVYMTKDVPVGMERCHVGQLTKVAVRAWQRAEGAALAYKAKAGIVTIKRPPKR